MRMQSMLPYRHKLHDHKSPSDHSFVCFTACVDCLRDWSTWLKLEKNLMFPLNNLFQVTMGKYNYTHFAVRYTIAMQLYTHLRSSKAPCFYGWILLRTHCLDFSSPRSWMFDKAVCVYTTKVCKLYSCVYSRTIYPVQIITNSRVCKRCRTLVYVCEKDGNHTHLLKHSEANPGVWKNQSWLSFKLFRATYKSLPAREVKKAWMSIAPAMTEGSWATRMLRTTKQQVYIFYRYCVMRCTILSNVKLSLTKSRSTPACSAS